MCSLFSDILLIARSVSAVIVSEGFTPGFADIMVPSHNVHILVPENAIVLVDRLDL